MSVRKRLLRGGNTQEKLILSAIEFDVNAISGLSNQVLSEIFESRENSVDIANNQVVKFFHGGQLIMPSDNFFLEWKEEGGEECLAHIFSSSENRLGESVFIQFYSHKVFDSEYPQGLLSSISVDEESFVIYRVKNAKYPQTEEGQKSVLASALKAASLIVSLNCPKGVKIEIAATHKGREKEGRRKGIKVQGKRIVTIDTSFFTESPIRSSNGSKKSLHFVRGHIRTLDLNSNKTTRVKPHWRGDPSIGTIDKSYVVK